MSNDLEKGVAIPEPTRNTHTKYPFKVMEVGESFLTPFEDGVNRSLMQKRIYAAVSWANKHYAPRSYITRTVDDGMRVWRVE